jgi:zinc and cadmium transporter
MSLVLAACSSLIVVVSLLGGLLPLATVMTHTRLQTYLSFSAGTMLGAAFFHMLPEAVRIGSPATLCWSAVGLLALFFLERFFSFHHHETKPASASHGSDAAHPELSTIAPTTDTAGPESHAHEHDHHDHSDSTSGLLPWGSAAFGLAVHSVAGGVALASAVASDFELSGHLASAGLGVLIATVVHKPADALTITSLMVRAGASRRATYMINLGFSIMIPAGVLLFVIGTAALGAGSSAAATITAATLAFSAGTFLCIALSDLLPELQFHSHDRLKLSIALLAGFSLMAAAAKLEPG